MWTCDSFIAYSERKEAPSNPGQSNGSIAACYEFGDAIQLAICARELNPSLFRMLPM
jgi:hypothetical protein